MSNEVAEAEKQLSLLLEMDFAPLETRMGMGAVVSRAEQGRYTFAIFLRYRELKVPPSGALWSSSETCSFSKEPEDARHLAAR